MSAPTAQAAPDADRQPAAVPRRARADGQPFASPRARALAREHGVDLSAVAPGPDGAVRAAQVRAAVTPAVGSATDGSARIGAAPVATSPVDGTPSGGAPVDSTSADSTPIDGEPVSGAPVGAAPVDGTSVGEAPVGSAPVDGTPIDDPARIGTARVDPPLIDTTRTDAAAGSRVDGAAPSSSRIALLVADVDVTGIERALRDGAAGFAAREGVEPTMFAAVVHAAVRSLRRSPGLHTADGTGPVALSVHRGDGTDWELPDAGDLGFAGLLRALGSPDPVPAPGSGPSGSAPGSAPMPGHGVTVVDSGAAGIALELVPPPPGRRAALTIGRVRRDVGVVTVDGAESIAIRSLVRLGLTVDTSRVDRAAAAAFLQDLEDRLTAGADLPATPSAGPRTLT